MLQSRSASTLRLFLSSLKLTRSLFAPAFTSFDLKALFRFWQTIQEGSDAGSMLRILTRDLQKQSSYNRFYKQIFETAGKTLTEDSNWFE